MNVRNWPAIIDELAPHASPLGRACFTTPDVDAVFTACAVTTPLRQAHFLSQILAETGGLVSKTLKENLNYSVERLLVVFTRYFADEDAARPYARNPSALANYVYADEHRSSRFKLGNTRPGDGWAYRGRGLIQLTGRAMYLAMGNASGLPLVDRPDLACDPAHALIVACAFWDSRGCNDLADRDNIDAVTRRVNGGTKGMPRRRQYLAKAKAILGVG